MKSWTSAFASTGCSTWGTCPHCSRTTWRAAGSASRRWRNPLGPGDLAPKWRAHRGIAEGVGDGREPRPQQPDQRYEGATPAPSHRGAEQAEALHPAGISQADLDRDPPAEGVADQ